MIELSRRFLWVKVDRDVTPKVPNRFSVRAYPTLIAMTPKAEKIHRWRGFGGLEKWMPDYQEALRRTELWAAGEEWLSEPTRPEKLCDVGELSSIPAPKQDHVWAMAFVGERLFVVQGMGRFKLHRIDPKTGQVEATFAITDSISDLTSDGTHLYAVSSSWSKGDPVRVLDPSTGKVIREIASSRNPGKRGSFSHGIAWCNGSLLIGSDSEIYTLNPETGECSPPQRTGVYRVTNMTFDGSHLVMVVLDRESRKRSDIYFFKPGDGASLEMARKVPSNFILKGCADLDGALYMSEGFIEDFDRQNRRVRIFPKELRIHRLVLPQTR